LVAFVGCNSADLTHHQLVGTWAGTIVRTFNADGTGYAMHRTGTVNFTWSVRSGNRLTIRNEQHDDIPRRENWEYSSSIAGSITLIDRENNTTETSFRFMADNTAAHPILGIWEWTNDSAWRYNFRMDGTGTRGVYGSTTEFTWQISGNVLSIHDPKALLGGDYNTLVNEIWAVTFSGRNMVLMFGETEFSYRRI